MSTQTVSNYRTTDPSPTIRLLTAPASIERTQTPVDPTPPVLPSDERLARYLRERIYAGDPEPGAQLDSADVMAARTGMSAAMVQRAYDLLDREGLVRKDRPRGTYVCDRFHWTARVTATVGRRPPARQLRDAEDGEPAVTGLDLSVSGQRGVWTMDVEAADEGPAVVAAVGVARAAGATGRVAVDLRPV